MQPCKDSGQRPGPPTVVVWGGGDLGTGVAHALFGRGCAVAVVDRPRPTGLRLEVSFATAAVRGRMVVEGVEAVHVESVDRAAQRLAERRVPVWTGPLAALLEGLAPDVLVDARLRGLTCSDLSSGLAPLVVALGPGIEAGYDADVVIETARGPELGRALWSGLAAAHSGIPGDVCGHTHERLLRASASGTLRRVRQLGDLVEAGEVVATVAGAPVRARIGGMIRGLKADGCGVRAGHKVGDVDPRRDPSLIYEMTDKARAIGAGVGAAVDAWRAGAPESPPRRVNQPCTSSSRTTSDPPPSRPASTG